MLERSCHVRCLPVMGLLLAVACQPSASRRGTGGQGAPGATGGAGSGGIAGGSVGSGGQINPGTGGGGGAGPAGATGGGAPGSGGNGAAAAGTGGSAGQGGAGQQPATGGRGASAGGGAGVPGMDAGVADAMTERPPATDASGPGIFGGGPVMPTTMHFDIGVHDPAMIWDGKRYYLVATGSGSTIRSSTNLLQWTSSGRFLPGTPAWVEPAIGATPDRNTPWAPDVTYFNGKFHIYYTASVFGKNTSVIGVATNTTMDPMAAGYAWVDQGLVVQTRATDNYNAIDPNVAFDDTGVPWLSFGSFWSGIKLRKLDPSTGKLASDDTTVYAIASRNGGAIEAPSIISRGGYYYLFVSFDTCCDGVNSTYRTMVGRSSAITGPYVDKSGKAMLQSGGDQLLASTGRYIGPGGGTAWKNGETYLYVHHYYDGQANGASKLAIRPLEFSADGWITLGTAVFP